MSREPSLADLRVWFAAAVAVGTLGIVAGWLLFPGPLLSNLLTVGLPLAAMAGYLVVAYVGDRTSLATLQFADSMYYLGFLFTLISLSVSLLAFARSAYAEDDVPGVVSRFGVALLTTVVGLGCRIYLVNFRKSMDDSLAQSEQALSRAGEALRQQLEQLSQDMTVQSKLMNESLHGAIDLSAAELKAAAAAGRSTIEATARSVASAVEAAGSQVEASARRGGEAVLGSLGELARKVEESRLPSELFTASLAPAVEGLAGQLTSLAGVLEASGANQREMLEAASALAEGISRLRSAGRDLASSLEGVEKGADRMAAFAQSLERVAAAVDAVGSGLEEHQKLVGRLRSEAEQDAGALALHRKALRENLRASERALRRVHEDLASAVRFIRREIGPGDPMR